MCVMQDSVSILMATYNGEKYIKEQIDSIIHQSYQDWQLLISDDCSTDNTLAILNEYAERDNRIHIVSSEVRFGSAQANFMHLLTFVDDGYVMFSDQDDIWHPDKVALSLSTMFKSEERYGAEKPLMTFTDSRLVDESGNVLRQSFLQTLHRNPYHTSLNYLLIQNVVAGCTTCLNSALIRLIRKIPSSEISNIAMHDWFFALAASVFGYVIYIPEATLDYRQHGSNVMGANQYSNIRLLGRLILRSKKTLAGARTGLKNSRRQANLFYKCYSATMPVESKKILEAFLSLPRLNGIQRICTLFRYSFWNTNIMENFVEIIISI